MEQSGWKLAIKIVIGLFLLALGWHWMQGMDEELKGMPDPNLVLSYIFKFFIIITLLIVIFFWDIVHGVGGRLSSLLFSDSSSVGVRPEYSIAEARVREGKYEEAIEEFRKVLKKHPNDINSHLRIAEILSTQFRRHDEAVMELQGALKKHCGPDTWAFVANRLADIQVERLHDYVAGRNTLQQVVLKFPNTKQATSAAARVLALSEKEANEKRGSSSRLKLKRDTPAA